MKRVLSLAVAATMAASLLSGCGAAASSAASSEAASTVPESNVEIVAYDDTQTADLVIVGAGGGGMGTALEAIDHGAEKVIILEMTSKTGGALNFTGGTMSAACTVVQEEDGIEDNLQSYVDDIIRIGSDFGGEPNPAMIEAYVKENVDVFQWFWDNGLSEYTFQTDKDGHRAILAPEHPLYSIPRSYKPKAMDPENYRAPAHEILDKALKAESKIEVVYNTQGIQLVPNEEGQVLTVIGKHLDTGKNTRYDSKKGIVVATGGYAANDKLRGEFTAFGGSYITGSPASADGNGLRMMQEVGAQLNHMGYIPTFPMGLETPGQPGFGSIASTYTWKVGGICINKEGNRFMNETEFNNSIREMALEEQTDALQYDVFTNETLDALKANNASYMWDAKFAEEGQPGYSQVVTASSPEELAEKLGVPVENLVKTVEDYNAAVESKTEDSFGRKFDGTVTPFNLAVNQLEGETWYAVPLHALCILTLGGVTTNVDCQVLDQADNVIPGLYAVGEVVGGVWGKFGSGGCGVMGPVAFGRIAARHALDHEPATGYTVKPSTELLDSSLFEKESSGLEYDMNATFNDGDYEATVDGQSGPMTVKLTVADGKIADVVVVSHNETESVASAALEQIPASIKEGNSPVVDAIAGATLTSERIMKAVIDCLDQAKA